MVLRSAAETVAITAAAMVTSLVLFGAFMYAWAKVPPD
jgi:hypothetical protein